MVNEQLLRNKLKRTIRLFLQAIADAVQEQLELEERVFPHTTYREYGRGATGKVAGSPRDVIDSGDLYKSFEFKFINNRDFYKGIYSYTSQYAAIIYLGYTTGSGTIIPDYPWIQIAISKLDLEQLFASAWAAS